MTHYEENYDQALYTSQLLLGSIQRLFMSMVSLDDFEEPDMNR